MALGKDVFGMTKKDYSEKITRIINNYRVGSRLIGEPRSFVLRSCSLCQRWSKMAQDPEVQVYLRNQDISSGHKVKMLFLEKGGFRQPVGKTNLINSLYPIKKTASQATPEEKHFSAVKGAMRNGVSSQIKEFRSMQAFPVICYITGKKICKGQRTDVDHVGVPFAEICDLFFSERGMKYSDVVLVGPPTAKRFKDPVLWEEWKEYHRGIAKFALVFSSANRSKGCGDYTTPGELLGSFSSDDPDTLSLSF